MDPRLAQVVESLSGGKGRVCYVLDADYRLAWVSRELRGFIGSDDDAELGMGEHILVAWSRQAWRTAVTPSSLRRLSREATTLRPTPEELPPEARQLLPPELMDVLGTVEPAELEPVRCGTIDYVQPGLPTYPVDYVTVSLRDERGELFGTVALMYLGLRPSLIALLGRGDEAMYERMARVMQPERRGTAILFADLQASGELSRTLPTATYFTLIRELTSTFDTLIAENGGIVGKHAGDGWTGFVLADDAGGPSAAVAGCMEVAHRLRAYAADRAGAALNLPHGASLDVNAGVHWGPSVYLGQLVPGSRLEITALGDEVNECARIQQSARNGDLLASKQAVELLDASTALRLGLDPARLTYAPLATMDTATEKARRDAGTVAVAAITL
ncbi:adenylate/guanylate cyclase domain-containing protein [Pseudonocardia acaciae]|uniref:adenylate/guanylate cyclase domain-containing protein n=1 Tax=Pseudonocardia acaciae TaxID=551276 RepID=UPI0004906798|nr:adenylate/guanylate cyclase domain-containing protein [Pseudonocardia acaciae]